MVIKKAGYDLVTQGLRVSDASDCREKLDGRLPDFPERDTAASARGGIVVRFIRPSVLDKVQDFLSRLTSRGVDAIVDLLPICFVEIVEKDLILRVCFEAWVILAKECKHIRHGEGFCRATNDGERLG